MTNNEKFQLLIVGCGYVGRQVIEACNHDPDRADVSITGITRSTASTKKVRVLGARAVQIDLDASCALPACGHRWSVLYLAPPPSSGEQDSRMRRFLSALSPPFPERFVYVSTSGVYGDCKGRLVDEDSSPNPVTGRARRRLDAESQVREWATAQNVPWLILRVPGIYGPGRLPLERIMSGEAILQDADCGPGNRIHRDDLARCCLAALDGRHFNRLINVSDDDPASSCAFTLEVAKQAGMTLPPRISMSEASKTFSAKRLSFLTESRRLDNRRMHELLGVMLEYPSMVDGIAASLKK